MEKQKDLAASLLALGRVIVLLGLALTSLAALAASVGCAALVLPVLCR